MFVFKKLAWCELPAFSQWLVDLAGIPHDREEFTVMTPNVDESSSIVTVASLPENRHCTADRGSSAEEAALARGLRLT